MVAGQRPDVNRRRRIWHRMADLSENLELPRRFGAEAVSKDASILASALAFRLSLKSVTVFGQ